ncbi:hypothetical protein M0812_24303 [Anaeramoeba flamelloides]|uniref:Uncharacterized protein n=1 Tax=Anaeramoeba flamelloides TaxID=1746091 RepID=A0AAV7YNC7_9EUKA|nr:hypothetical protein M0812_24303 [Anaeramoeba flamelloides]
MGNRTLSCFFFQGEYCNACYRLDNKTNGKAIISYLVDTGTNIIAIKINDRTIGNSTIWISQDDEDETLYLMVDNIIFNNKEVKHNFLFRNKEQVIYYIITYLKKFASKLGIQKILLSTKGKLSNIQFLKESYNTKKLKLSRLGKLYRDWTYNDIVGTQNLNNLQNIECDVFQINVNNCWIKNLKILKTKLLTLSKDNNDYNFKKIIDTINNKIQNNIGFGYKTIINDSIIEINKIKKKKPVFKKNEKNLIKENQNIQPAKNTQINQNNKEELEMVEFNNNEKNQMELLNEFFNKIIKSQNNQMTKKLIEDILNISNNTSKSKNISEKSKWQFVIG